MKKLAIDSVRDQVIGIDKKVPLIDGRLVQYINLDNAATRRRCALFLTR